MKRFLPVIAALITLAALATPTHAQTPPSCQFILGFQTLHDLDPADIGVCMDNQAFAANGDAQQHTTKGLMAWRKADNWTAFTNGYMTWINGPNGLQNRLNSVRFPWEADNGTAPAPAPGTYSCNVIIPDWQIEVTVSGPSSLASQMDNTCTVTRGIYAQNAQLAPTTPPYVSHDAPRPTTCTTSVGPLTFGAASFGNLQIQAGNPFCQQFTSGFYRALNGGG